MSLPRLGHGLAAGAAGINMLNAIAYPDLAFRARPSSNSPSRAVETYATLTALGGRFQPDGRARQNGKAAP